MPIKYVDVFVEEHPEIPDGCELRFHAVGESRAVARVWYEPLVGLAGEFEVLAADGAGLEGPARAVPVDDSGAGTSTLVFGGTRGLRLRRLGDAGADAVAEPYLLLADDAIIG